jgi:Flp pilus assembly protein TadD
MELTIEQTMQQAVAAQNQGKLEEAEQCYRAILKSQPTHPEANHNLGVIAASVDKAGMALPLFKVALNAKPKIGQFWLSYIDALIKDNQINTAKAILQQGKDTGLFGNRFDNLDNQLNANVVGPPESQLNILLKQYNNGQYGETEKLALLITQQFPEHQFSWKILGAVFGQTNRQSEAINANQKAIQLAPNDAEIHNNLGNALKEVDRLEEAEVSLRQAIELKSNYAEAHNNLGITLKELDRLDEAEVHFTQAITIKFDYAEAHNNVGITLKELGRLDEAEVSLRQALAIRADFFYAHNNLGGVLKELGRLDEAEVKFRQAIALKSDFVETHYNLGCILQELGRLAEAEVSFRQAIVLKPDDAEIHNNLGVTLQELGRLDEAEVNLRQAIVLKSNAAETHCNLGCILEDQGRLNEAEVSYRQALELDSDYEKANFNLGMLFSAIKQYEKAAECFKLSDFYKSKFYLLRCLYLLDKESLFYAQLDYFIEKDEVHPIIGSLVCRSALRYGVEKRNLFCKKPLNYILKTDLSTQYDFNEVFVKTVKTILSENRVPKKIQGLLSNGYQTHGNLFDLEPDFTRDIQKIIRLEVEKYKLSFKNSKEGLITSWPADYYLYGWLIDMKTGGELKPHMHEQGWLSGSIYINVPPKSQPNSGNLVVCIENKLTGENQNQGKSIDVVTGDLCLFPASLLHYTVPFESEEERIVLAFDVVPKSTLKSGSGL